MITKTRYKIKKDNTYQVVHFETSADLIVQNENNRLVTDIEKNSWNSKADKKYVDDMFENFQGDAAEGTVVIDFPILLSGEKKYRLGVTVFGELTLEEVIAGITANLYIQSPNGMKWQLLIEDDILHTVEVEIEEKVVGKYLQAPQPYGVIYKLGITDDGNLVTSPICDIDLIADSSLSQLKTWSSVKIMEEMKTIKVPLASADMNGLMSIEDKNTLVNLPGTLEELKKEIRGEIDLTYETIANKAVEKVTNSVQGAETSIIDKTTEGLTSINNLIDTGYVDFEKIKQDAINAYDGKLEKSAITISTNEPTAGTGKHGDIWIVYGE